MKVVKRMASKARTQELIKSIYNSVIDMDEVKTRKLCLETLNEGIDAYHTVTHGLTAAMDKVGMLYAEKTYFVPELLLCSDALYAGLEVLRPYLKINEQATRRQIIIGTVEGDIHDIGKNLVKIMFEAAGWEVRDLGRDVVLSKFLEEYKRQRADIIAISALMTTSMLAMPKVIKMIRAEYPDAAIMVGGAPLTREIATSYGANGYAENAGTAVPEAQAMLARLAK
jgi:methanogenic corrinoid protein MtbC1